MTLGRRIAGVKDLAGGAINDERRVLRWIGQGGRQGGRMTGPAVMTGTGENGPRDKGGSQGSEANRFHGCAESGSCPVEH